MSGDPRLRRELAGFLRARRQQIVRAELSLPPVGGRERGLRREEIAYLSGLSVTWYTWLEQGRDIKPSRQVLDALARTMSLSPAEYSYIMSLAGYSGPQPDGEAVPRTMPSDVPRLLETLARLPAFVLAPDWHILAWTQAWSALYPKMDTVDPADRNLLWLFFTDPDFPDLLLEWEDASRRLIAEFRGHAGPRLADPVFVEQVERLMKVSDRFREGWERHEVSAFTARRRRFLHPRIGEIHLEVHHLAFPDNSDLRLLLYTPVPGTDAEAKLAELLHESRAETTDAR